MSAVANVAPAPTERHDELLTTIAEDTARILERCERKLRALEATYRTPKARCQTALATMARGRHG